MSTIRWMGTVSGHGRTDCISLTVFVVLIRWDELCSYVQPGLILVSRRAVVPVVILGHRFCNVAGDWDQLQQSDVFLFAVRSDIGD